MRVWLCFAELKRTALGLGEVVVALFPGRWSEVSGCGPLGLKAEKFGVVVALPGAEASRLYSWAGYQGLKSLATNVRPPGEDSATPSGLDGAWGNRLRYDQ